MRNLLLIIFSICVFAVKATEFSPANGDKAAILMVHFGTTFDDTRAKTIDAINSKVASTFSGIKVVEAYTSRIVLKRLKARGIVKYNPQEALMKLAADGYTHVFVQSTNIIDGIEAESLRDDVEYMIPFFKDIRVGRPLLYSVEDCEKVVSVLSERYSDRIGKKQSVVLVGHGTSTPANAIYSQIDYMFSASGNNRFHVATVEGYPTIDNIISKLRAEKSHMVSLVPLMFVAGDHARNDIDVDWRRWLENEGFKVETVIEGLGEIPGIQDIFVSHIHDGMKERPLRAKEIKASFIRSNL